MKDILKEGLDLAAGPLYDRPKSGVQYQNQAGPQQVNIVKSETIPEPEKKKNIVINKGHGVMGQTKEELAQAKWDIERMKAGRPTVQQEQAQMVEQQRQQQIAAQLGQTPQPVISQPMQQVDANGVPIDWKQVGLSTAADPGVWTRAATFAAAGAVAGGTAGLGIGAVPGALIGFGIGIAASVMSNIKSQKTENIQSQRLVLTDGQANLNYLALLAQADPQNSDKYVDSFNEQLDRIAEAHANLKADTMSNLNLMVEQDGTKELQRFENFYAAGGRYDYYKQKMQNALIAPNPEQAIMELSIVQQSIAEEEE